MNALETALLAARTGSELIDFQDFEHDAAEGLNASDLTFRQARFLRCRFTDCDFSAAAFYSCEFTDCSFASCRFARSFWRDSVLTGCKADGGDFRKSRLKGCTLSGLRLRYANLSGALWERCVLSDCDLKEASCQELKVTKTALEAINLAGADLFRAVLAGADLSGCTLDGISLSASCQELKGAKIHASQAAVVARILGIEVDG